ncbi:hypothetical protein Tco_0359423 [Tanacetum coccineum]
MPPPATTSGHRKTFPAEFSGELQKASSPPDLFDPHTHSRSRAITTPTQPPLSCHRHPTITITTTTASPSSPSPPHAAAIRHSTRRVRSLWVLHHTRGAFDYVPRHLGCVRSGFAPQGCGRF